MPVSTTLDGLQGFKRATYNVKEMLRYMEELDDYRDQLVKQLKDGLTNQLNDHDFWRKKTYYFEVSFEFRKTGDIVLFIRALNFINHSPIFRVKFIDISETKPIVEVFNDNEVPLEDIDTVVDCFRKERKKTYQIEQSSLRPPQFKIL